jgi:hypothetical protein
MSMQWQWRIGCGIGAWGIPVMISNCESLATDGHHCLHIPLIASGSQ